MKVLVALSGGVDSAVAAVLALQAGHDVTGVYLDLFGGAETSGWVSPTHQQDARKVADLLGIPFEVWDVSASFRRHVVNEFTTEYDNGLTPNPCVTCNKTVKFGELVDGALVRGFDRVVTGHYARVEVVAGQTVLRRSVFYDKDQSYVVASVGPQRLAHIWFPLGELPSKEVTRQIAAQWQIPVAQKPESFDICFIPDGDTAGFLRRRLGDRPGKIVDLHDEVVGEHQGTFGFTIGQRRGLRLGRPAADGLPRYVVDLDSLTGTVRVGPAAALDVHELQVVGCTWFVPPTVMAAAVQIRAHGVPVDCTVIPEQGSRVRIVFGEPQRGTAPGQAIVLYRDDQVLLHGTLVRGRGPTS